MAPVGPNMPGSFVLPAPNAYRSIFRHKDGTYDWETELNYGWDLVDTASCGSLAAVIVECIQSSAGIHVLPPGYLKAMKAHCEKRGMLLIVDEAQTGIGRYDNASITFFFDMANRGNKGAEISLQLTMKMSSRIF
jgi:4-aminobutyrate aminotransferase-like enzyme